MSNFGFTIKNIVANQQGDPPTISTMPTTWSLLAIDIVREVNRIPRATLTLSDGDVATQTFAVSNDLFFNPGQTIQIAWQNLTAPLPQPIIVFTGLVVSQNWEANLSHTLLTIGLRDFTIKMTQSRKSRVFQNSTEKAAITTILANYTDQGSPTIDPNNQLPDGGDSQDLVQYNCTDWDFMLTRAQTNGLLVSVNDGVISINNIALNANQPSQDHTFIYGQGIYSMEMEANINGQYNQVTSKGWDIASQNMAEKNPVDVPAQLSPGNLAGQRLLDTDYQDLSPAPLQDYELQNWCNGTLARSCLGLVRGRISVEGNPNVKLLDTIAINGVGNHFSAASPNNKALVTGLRHRVTNQLGWVTDIQFGHSEALFPSRDDVAAPPAAGLIPPVSGLQIGKVVAFVNDNCGQSKIQVKVPALSETAIWARVAFPEAGNTRGFYAWPKTDDEVVLGYFNDDPRQPVILGSLYSTTNAPAIAPDETNLVKGWVSQSGMFIKFDDTDNANLISMGKGSQSINMSFPTDNQQSSITIKLSNTNQIVMDSNGVTITSSNLTVDASGQGQNIIFNGSVVSQVQTALQEQADAQTQAQAQLNEALANVQNQAITQAQLNEALNTAASVKQQADTQIGLLKAKLGAQAKALEEVQEQLKPKLKKGWW